MTEFEKDRNLFVMPTEAELEAIPAPSPPQPHYTQPNYKWDSLDGDPLPTAGVSGFDPTALLTAALHIVGAHLREFGIMLLIVAFEILRNRRVAAADDREQWRHIPWSQ